jgi:cytochrome b involved in lipid metabolism
MKKELYLSLLGVVIIIVLAVYYIMQYAQSMANINSGQNTNVGLNGNADAQMLTTDEVAKHAVASDCWIIIRNQVYNVTGYLTSHPGGAAIVVPSCGQDATQAFDTKGGRGTNHSGVATSDLKKYLIGQIDSALSNLANDNTNDNTNTNTNVSAPTDSSQIAVSTSVTLTAGEVAKHASRTDCWIIVSGYVYNVTGYIAGHPGGAAIIIPTCGQDATQAYNSKGGSGSSHSGTAAQDLRSSVIGKLGSSTTTQQISNTNKATLPSSAPTPKPSTNTNNTGNSGNLVLTTAEVAKHSSSTNCWIIISNKVYNVTSYLSRHAGGAAIIIPLCGGDATQAYSTKGGRGASHSSAAAADLQSLLIGTLGSNTNTQVINNTNTVPVNNNRNQENEEEDD